MAQLLLPIATFVAIFSSSPTLGQNVGGAFQGCLQPPLAEGVMLKSREEYIFRPGTEVKVICKAGYYTRSASKEESMICTRRESDGLTYQWTPPVAPIDCQQGCELGDSAQLSGFNEASPLLHIFEWMRIECHGVIKGWTYQNRLSLRSGLKVFIVVFDRVGLNSFRMANYSVIVTSDSQGWVNYIIPPALRFEVRPGQVIGVAYENWQLDIGHVVIPFSYQDADEYPTYVGFVDVGNLDGRTELRSGREIYPQTMGRKLALYTIVTPAETVIATPPPTTTTTTTTVATTTTTRPTTTMATTRTSTTDKSSVDYSQYYTDQPVRSSSTTTTRETVWITRTQPTVPTTTAKTLPIPPYTEEPRGCGPALDIPNAVIRTKTFQDRSRNNDKVYYECVDGYQLAFQDEMATSIATMTISCCVANRWTNLPNCVPQNCN